MAENTQMLPLHAEIMKFLFLFYFINRVLVLVSSKNMWD